MTDPNSKANTEPPEKTEATQPEAGKNQQPVTQSGALAFIRRHQVEITIICGIAVAIATVIGLVVTVVVALENRSGQNKPGGYVNAPAGPLSPVFQVKQIGVPFWADDVTILPGGGRVRYRTRIENTGSIPLTGLVAGASLPDPIAAVPGQCWYRSEKCQGSSVEDGVELPDLQPGNWGSVVFAADVSPEAHGGRYRATLRISSDQTGELVSWVPVYVSTSSAEDAVRPFFHTLEETLKFREQPAEVAFRSKRLLIGQWSELAIERPHSFRRLPRARGRLEGRPITLDDLHHEHRLEGQLVKLRGRLLSRPDDFQVDANVVEQRFELGAAGERTRLRCYTSRHRSHLLHEGDEVEAIAVVAAWGPSESPKADLTVAVCPAIRVLKQPSP